MTISHVNVQSARKESRRKDRRRAMKQRDEDLAEVDDDVRRFYGDGLVVRMHSNHRTLKVTGDGCRVILFKNSGSVHIVGDGCQLSVSHNVGDIEYIGDGGRVRLGPDSSKEKVVKFVGDDSEVIFGSGCETESIIEFRKTLRQPSDLKRITKDERCGRSGCARGESAYSCERAFERRPSCEGQRDHEGYRLLTVSSSEQESLDNALNDITERQSRGKYSGRNDETRKFSRQRTVTAKIITEVHSDGRCVRKRFSDSLPIVNSINDSLALRERGRTLGTHAEIK